MNRLQRFVIGTASVLAISMGASFAHAQQEGGPPPPPPPGGQGFQQGPGGPEGGPPPGGPGGPGAEGGRRGPRGGGGPGMMGGGMGGPGMGVPGGRGPGGPGGPGGPETLKLEQLHLYLDVVNSFTTMAKDPSATGVAAVIYASDLLRARGPDKAIEVFTGMLPKVQDPTVKRAIQIQLLDLYKATGQGDKALEQLTVLITGSPGSTSSGSTAAPKSP